MKVLRLALAIFGLLALTTPARVVFAQNPTGPEKRIFDVGLTSLVKLRVTGKLKSSESFNENGTGFYFATNGNVARILTARHVVGASSAFESVGDKVDRRIYVTILTPQTGPVELTVPLQGTSENPFADKDVAQIYGNGKGPPDPFRLSKQMPQAGDRLWVLSWPDSEVMLQPPTEVTVGVTDSSDGPLIRLSRKNGQFIKSESGSPVLNDSGAVVAILVLKGSAAIQPIGYALPVLEFANWLTDGIVGPTPKETSECISTKLAELRAPAPFSVEKSVRCQNMGDSQQAVLAYEAPPGFQILGQVTKSDRTNYGDVSSVVYDNKGGAYVREVRTSISCKTPGTPFGPGGWSGTTLSGFIERVVTPQDMANIGRICKGE